MTRWIRIVGVVGLALLSLGFEWPGRVTRLTAQLRSEDVNQRREAARLLGEHTADDAREALLIALDDNDASVRREAIAASARVGMREHVPVLIDWLNDPAADTRATAAEALGTLHEPRAEQPLIRALGDGDAHVRAVAAAALGKLAGPESLTPLLGRLDDPDPSARLAAVQSLGMLSDPRALVPLMARTQDSAVEVRLATLAVLGELRDARALPPLLRGLDDDTDIVRLAAVAALGALRQPAAIEPLRARLVGADSRMGRAVLAALSAIGTEPAERLIVEQLGKPELSRGAVDVIVERVRRVRQLDPARANAVITLLVAALSEEVSTARATAIEDALVGCSQHVSIVDALPTLLSALSSQRGTLPMTSLALAATHDERALLPLLERLEGAPAEDQLALLRALDVLMMALPADGRAADPLLNALSHAQPEAIPLVARLLGRTRATRARTALVELLDHPRPEVQLAAIEALGTLGDTQTQPQLLALLEDNRERVRTAAGNALGQVLDPPAALAELDRLPAASDGLRVSLLSAVSHALQRLTKANALAGDHKAKLLAKLTPLAADEDGALAALAIDALSTLGTPEAANVIATALRAPNTSRRAHAAAALGSFDDARARHVLRFVMTHDQVDVAVAAATALGRTGESEDAASLAKLAQRYHWPFPAAASYAITLIARRGLLKPLASQPMLCELGRSREPVVRANVAIAMAELGVGACDNGPDPLEWLKDEHAPVVRSAAARWVYSAVNAGRMDRDRGMGALSECAAASADPRVASACAGPRLPPLDGTIAHVVHDPDGRSRLRHRLLALELDDGSVFVGQTDDNGFLRVAPTPGDHAVVTDPGLLPLEPLAPTARPSSAAPRPEAAAPAPP